METAVLSITVIRTEACPYISQGTLQLGHNNFGNRKIGTLRRRPTDQPNAPAWLRSRIYWLSVFFTVLPVLAEQIECCALQGTAWSAGAVSLQQLVDGRARISHQGESVPVQTGSSRD